MPAAAFQLREGIGFGVVIEVVRPAIEQQVRPVQPAVFPGRSVGGSEDGVGQRPELPSRSRDLASPITAALYIRARISRDNVGIASP